MGSFSLSPSRRASRMWKWRGGSMWCTAGWPSKRRRARKSRTSTMKVGVKLDDVSGNIKHCVQWCMFWLCVHIRGCAIHVYCIQPSILGRRANTSTYWVRGGPISLSPHTHNSHTRSMSPRTYCRCRFLDVGGNWKKPSKPWTNNLLAESRLLILVAHVLDL